MSRLAATVAPGAAALVAVAAIAAAASATAPLDVVAALVLAPVACAVTSLGARRIGGRRFGIAAGWTYAVLPLLGIAYCLSTYRHIFVHEALPQFVGLKSPWLLAVGVCIAGVFAVAPSSLLAAAGVVAAVVAIVVWGDSGLADVRGGLHETAWSPTLIAWVVVAGTAGVAIRAPRLAVAVGGWIVAAVLGAAHGGYGDHGEFWRNLAPAAPAAALVIASLRQLVPRLRPARAPARPNPR